MHLLPARHRVKTLNLSHLEVYATGGTIHIIVNNQLGYNRFVQETRSSPYASDFARGLRFRSSTLMQMIRWPAWRPFERLSLIGKFIIKDFVIDLVGYRRYGHNEGMSRPLPTLMYRKIHDHPTVRSLWADRMV